MRYPLVGHLVYCSQTMLTVVRGQGGSHDAFVKASWESNGLGTNIYIGNLPFTATSEEVEELFGGFGSVTSVNLITDRETGRLRGFGFVEMGTDAEAAAAIEALNGTELGGRTLTVNEARPRADRGGDRRGGGGGGGRPRW